MRAREADEDCEQNSNYPKARKFVDMTGPQYLEFQFSVEATVILLRTIGRVLNKAAWMV